jgi:thiosulfate/3-mercaptopyruvate sulfurtransferase
MDNSSFGTRCASVSGRSHRSWLWVLALLCLFCVSAFAQGTNASGDAAIPADRLVQPSDLAHMLRSPDGNKPLILQVGSHVLYAQAHIPGSEYTGAGGEDAGLKALEARMQDLPRNRSLVIYCGCCPWKNCPNIRAAYRQLAAMGLTQVKVLYLENNFGSDWVAKGYPVEKGR